MNAREAVGISEKSLPGAQGAGAEDAYGLTTGAQGKWSTIAVEFQTAWPVRRNHAVLPKTT
jgi:hypothetical protein